MAHGDRLTAEKAMRAPSVADGRYSDAVDGLSLRVKGLGRWWEFRWADGAGTRRSKSLGSISDVSLADARSRALRLAEVVRQGGDPRLELIQKRKEAAAQLAREQTAGVTLGEFIKSWLPGHLRTLSSDKNAAQWRQHLLGGKRSEHYIAPIFDKPMNEITRPEIIAILEALWHTKSETARRLGQKLNALWIAAIARDLVMTNPADPKVIVAALGKLGRSKVERVPGGGERVVERGHHAALPWEGVPYFYARLCTREGDAAFALRLVILTAMRAGEVRSATWEDFRRGDGVWTVPANKMKMKKLHQVPLSDEALTVLMEMEVRAKAAGRSLRGTIFQGATGRTLSDMAMTALLKRMNAPVTAHGFRSTFRDWVGDQTDYPRELAEMALAHVVAGVEGRYRRGDALAKRKAMMDDWSAYVASHVVEKRRPVIPPPQNVVPLRGRLTPDT